MEKQAGKVPFLDGSMLETVNEFERVYPNCKRATVCDVVKVTHNGNARIYYLRAMLEYLWTYRKMPQKETQALSLASAIHASSIQEGCTGLTGFFKAYWGDGGCNPDEVTDALAYLSAVCGCAILTNYTGVHFTAQGDGQTRSNVDVHLMEILKVADVFPCLLRMVQKDLSVNELFDETSEDGQRGYKSFYSIGEDDTMLYGNNAQYGMYYIVKMQQSHIASHIVPWMTSWLKEYEFDYRMGLLGDELWESLQCIEDTLGNKPF